MAVFTTAMHGTVAVVTLDIPGAPVNVLSSTFKNEVEAEFTRLRSDASVTAVVLISGKPDNFIAGADIEEFTRLTTREEFDRLVSEGQAMINMVDAFPKPVTAAINGAC